MNTLPLTGLHRRLGAEIGEPDGFPVPPPYGPGAGGGEPDGSPVPLRYGPVEEEIRALQETAGIADLSWRGRLELLGAERLRLPPNHLACGVEGPAPAGRPGPRPLWLRHQPPGANPFGRRNPRPGGPPVGRGRPGPGRADRRPPE